MQVLKIKDNINLDDLCYLGFKYLDKEKNILVYMIDQNWIIDEDRKIRYMNKYNTNNEDEIGVKIAISSIVYYLFKLDFVEVAEVK